MEKQRNFKLSKLSVIIPARDERFLTPTIDDIFRNARGDTEVIAVLDSDKWPLDWKDVTARHPRLHTIHNGSPRGMRHSINAGVASAISRGAKFIAKFDGHCSFGEGFDEILKAECDDDWIVVPRRLRLEPESWTIAEAEKPPHDYHYLSFPDDPKDFGGPGLNGRPWVERTKTRMDVLLDEEMSSQGSGWFMHADYFTRLELMDESSYGPFWNEFQEIGLKCWLSGGKVMVNKKTSYAHLHKGKKYGRGYKLDERWLQQGRTHTLKWIYNEAWPKQTLPFEWLIDHFWPVPTWPENWREMLYATRKARLVGVVDTGVRAGNTDTEDTDLLSSLSGLQILSATYGIGGANDIDVTEQLQSLVVNDSLDIIVNNSTLAPGQNPFRGQRKQLAVKYTYDGGASWVTSVRHEKEALIIGGPRQEEPRLTQVVADAKIYDVALGPADVEKIYVDSKSVNFVQVQQLMTPAALNDFLLRRFNVSPYRLRAPMPIELPNFHRNDLAQLFAELGFNRGAEIGVAEGNYSEIICKVNPNVELFCIDPWYGYPANPQNKTSQRHEHAYNETKRKLEGYNTRIMREASIDAVMKFDSDSLDFVYVDGNHLYDFVSLDLILWSNKVRSGGIISGDDYYQLDQKRWVGGGVVEAVQAYVNAHRIAVWYTFQGHKSVDFMWVKP